MLETKSLKKSISIIEAPVATIASTMLYFTKSEYRFIQPAADVDPAKVKKIEQSLSRAFR